MRQNVFLAKYREKGGLFMIEKQSLPSAPILIESIRSIGYSFETAIADLIDNSISAKATKIDILSIPDEEILKFIKK